MESSKKDIEKVAEYPEVSRIVERSPYPQADDQNSATRTINAADSDGPLYNVDQASVGILEDDHPSDFVEANIADTRWVTDNQGQHVTEVTECAASNDDSLPGTAHEADVYSADGAHDNEANLDDYVNWFASNGVAAFNTSRSLCSCGRTITHTGIDYEESCFNQNLTHVQSAGNENSCRCGNLNVRSPARTFSSIAVGNIDDQNTPADRSDDTINDTSCYINPDSRNASDRRYPHQKPEVAAVGTSIDTPYNTFEDDDNLAERTQISQYEEPLRSPSGTSYSAPNVAGMLAILEDQYGGLANAPDTAKAVSMASANHDIESYSRDRIGAGCIDVDEALSILFNNNFITDTFDENNNSQDYFIELEQGDTVDIVLVWRSDMTQQDWSNRSDLQSDINLELNFYDPDYNLIGYDGGYDRAWQFIEGDTESITIDQTGSHRIKVWNSRWEADSSLRHFTLAWRTY
jgi:hypothetical protein